MYINDDRLKNTLDARAKYIGHKAPGLDSWISLVAFWITIGFADIKRYQGQWVWYLLLFLIFASIMYALYLAYKAYKAFNDKYTADMLYNDLKGISAETHNFSLMIVKNGEGKFLMEYDKAWSCWMFPYCANHPKDNDSFVKAAAGTKGFGDCVVSYVDKHEFTKKSERDNITKDYCHYYYSVNHADGSQIIIESKGFKWMSIQQMKADKNIKQKNMETVQFVQKHF